METKKNQMEMLEIKNIVKEIKNVFGLFSRLKTAKERITGLENKSVEITQTEKKSGNKREKERTEHQRTLIQY